MEYIIISLEPCGKHNSCVQAWTHDRALAFTMANDLSLMLDCRVEIRHGLTPIAFYYQGQEESP